MQGNKNWSPEIQNLIEKGVKCTLSHNLEILTKKKGIKEVYNIENVNQGIEGSYVIKFLDNTYKIFYSTNLEGAIEFS